MIQDLKSLVFLQVQRLCLSLDIDIIKPGIYEITLSGLISGADDIHGGTFICKMKMVRK